MAPRDPWRNSTPDFGAEAFCTTNSKDPRPLLTSTSSTISSTYSSQKWSLRWTSPKKKNSGDHLGRPTRRHKKQRAGLSMPHSGLKPKNENEPKEEDDLRRKTTFDKRQPLTEDDFWWKTIFDERWPLTEDELWWKMTFDGKRPLTEYNLRWKTTFDRVYSILPEKNVYDYSPWQPQHNWPQTGNPISWLNRK